MIRLIEDSSLSTTCIPSTNVQWLNWKLYLEQFFTVPTKLKLSDLHRFSFSNLYKGKVEGRLLSTSDCSNRYNLLRRKVDISIVVESWARKDPAVRFPLVWSPLIEVPSAKNGTRKQYLTMNILDRYYRNNTALREQYFGSGDDGIDRIGEENVA